MPVSGTYTIKTTGSTDTMGQLYNSSTSTIGSEIDDVGDLNFAISANLTASTSYYIRVRGFSTTTGQYTLNIILDMINHFKNGNGADYSNATLKAQISAHPNTQAYIELVKNEFLRELVIQNGKLADLQYMEATIC